MGRSYLEFYKGDPKKELLWGLWPMGTLENDPENMEVASWHRAPRPGYGGEKRQVQSCGCCWVVGFKGIRVEG